MTTDVPTRPGRAFSNGTEWEIWASNWCMRCTREAAFWAGKSDVGCDTANAALFLDETPIAWMETEDGCHDRYRCIEFRSIEDGNGGEDPEPKPKPEPPDMDGLFDRPERHTRMYVNPDMQRVTS